MALLMLVLVFFTKLAIKDLPDSIAQKKLAYSIVDTLENEDVTYGYTYSIYNRIVNVMTNEKITSTALSFNSQTNKFFIEKEFSYLYEHKKPENKDKVFIIVDLKKDREQFCFFKKRIPLDELGVIVYIYNTDDLDKIIEFDLK